MVMESGIMDQMMRCDMAMEYEAMEELIEEVLQLHKSIDALEELIKIQCSNGNWNYDPYMHGMANGMLLAMSLFKNDCNFLNPPEEWLCDRQDDEQPIQCGD